MKEKKYTIFSNWNRLTTLMAAILAFFLLAGCVTGGNYGKFDSDRDLDNMFLNYEILPDHRYYTYGGYDAPTAILAISSDYELVNSGNLWVPIPNADSAQMRKWIDTIAPEQNFKDEYFAKYILDPKGKRVGAWYSGIPFTNVKFPGDNKVQVYTPVSTRSFDTGILRGLGY